MYINLGQEILAKLQALEEVKTSNKYEEFVGEAKYAPKVEPGTYQSVISDASIERNSLSKYGINDKIIVTYTVFKFTEGDIAEEMNIRQTYWKSNTENSAFYKNFKELLNKDPRKGFILKDIIGSTCEVVIEHNTSEKGTFANIVSVKRIAVNTNMDLVKI